MACPHDRVEPGVRQRYWVVRMVPEMLHAELVVCGCIFTVATWDLDSIER